MLAAAYRRSWLVKAELNRVKFCKLINFVYRIFKVDLLPNPFFVRDPSLSYFDGLWYRMDNFAIWFTFNDALIINIIKRTNSQYESQMQVSSKAANFA